MEKICICALGNPGEQYKGTRHNIGFDVLNAFCEKYDLKLLKKNKVFSKLTECVLFEKKIVLVFPQTFMNLSGKAFHRVLTYYDINLHNTLLLYDDIDLPFGEYRFRHTGSAGTHNGMKSIVASVKSREIPRLRIGIGKPSFQALDEYVLDVFNHLESEQIEYVIRDSIQNIELFLSHDLDAFKSEYIKKMQSIDNSKAKEIK